MSSGKDEAVQEALDFASSKGISQLSLCPPLSTALLGEPLGDKFGMVTAFSAAGGIGDKAK